MLIAVY